MRYNISVVETFVELLRAGLWEQVGTKLNLDLNDKVDWDEVYRLAEEQSVIGVVLAGLEHSNVKPSHELLLQWIGEVQMIELQNKSMNEYVAKLIENLRNADVYTLLVKGQGIAQCYERPLWRANGDIDLLLSSDEYRKAKVYLSEKAQKINDENPKSMHLGMTIDSWEVELHGTLRSGLWNRLENVIDDAQRAVFYNGNVRSWMNGNTQIFLPRADEDLVFVFFHILQHFFIGGIGLRQICDWCRLLWIYKEKINVDLLSKRIKAANAMTEWKVFATLAVDYLGMPAESMPFYSDAKKWKKSARRLLYLIIETGNMGHNRDVTYQQEYSGVKRKLITFNNVLQYSYKQFHIFPLDAIKVWWIMFIRGTKNF